METQIYPEPTTGAFIFNPKGEILLIRTHKWHGKYAVPGGHIELGETMKQALKREVKEETGLDIFDIQPIYVAEMIYDQLFFKKRHYIFLDYFCRTKSIQVKLNDEAEDYLWIAPEKAIKLSTIEPYAKKTIRVYFALQNTPPFQRRE